MAFFWGPVVSEATGRRQALAAGTTWVELQAAEVERLERDPVVGPPVQQLSADGAMVPLVGGVWAEVKTLAIGTVERSPGTAGGRQSHTRELSYFSRLADAETFTRLALVELQRRGTESAGTVVAPMDGAEWQQTFLDVHRPDAVRILDFPHGLEHLAAAAQASFGAGSAEASAWLEAQAHELKHGDPDRVLAALRALPTAQATDPTAAEAAREGTLHYLEKRREQIRYALFLALGYPIGSGCIESANKLVVEARLKGSGMHWARSHVNPMLGLRTILCSHRWPEAWPQIEAALRTRARARRAARREPQQPAPAPAPVPPRPTPAMLRPSDLLSTCPPTIVNGRPTRDHPWKKHPLLSPRHPPAKL